MSTRHESKREEIEEARLARRVRTAYEWARVKRAALRSWPVVVPLVLAQGRGASEWGTEVALLLAVVYLVAFVNGGPLERGVAAGLLAGSASLVANAFLCDASGSCRGPDCMSFCVPLAATFAGIGYLVFGRARASDVRHRTLVALTAIATSTIGRPAVLVGGAAGIASALVLSLLFERRS